MTRWYRLNASGNASIYPGIRNTVARLLLCFIYKKLLLTITCVIRNQSLTGLRDQTG